MKRLAIVASVTLAACSNPNANGNGNSPPSTEDGEAAYPAPGKYDVTVSHDGAGMSATTGFEPAGSVCISAEQVANPRRLILGQRADCDDRALSLEGGTITADLRCSPDGGDIKTVPVHVYGVYKSDYWRVSEEIRIFGQTKREERIYRRTGDCK